MQPIHQRSFVERERFIPPPQSQFHSPGFSPRFSTDFDPRFSNGVGADDLGSSRITPIDFAPKGADVIGIGNEQRRPLGIIEEDPNGDDAAVFLKDALDRVAKNNPNLPSAAEINNISAFDGERLSTLEALMDEILLSSADLNDLRKNTLLDLERQFEDLRNGTYSHHPGQIAAQDGVLSAQQIQKLDQVIDKINEAILRAEFIEQQFAENKKRKGPGGGGGGPKPPPASPFFPPFPSIQISGAQTQPAQIPPATVDPNLLKQGYDTLAAMNQTLAQNYQKLADARREGERLEDLSALMQFSFNRPPPPPPEPYFDLTGLFNLQNYMLQSWANLQQYAVQAATNSAMGQPLQTFAPGSFRLSDRLASSPSFNRRPAFGNSFSRSRFFNASRPRSILLRSPRQFR